MTQLCSNCFIQLLYTRLDSLYLPDQDYTDYLISQYQDILDVCNYSAFMPELVIQAAANYDSAPPPVLNITSPPDGECNGQLVVKSTLDPNANCQSIATAFNVATGAVQWAIGNSNCSISQSSVCLPAPCELHEVPDGATCDSLSTTFSTTNLTVTSTQFLTWNPYVNGLCDDLLAGDQVCAGPPGGSYIVPPSSNSANSSSYARGGNTGSDAGDGTGLSPSGVGSNAPSPTQTGIVPGCVTYDQPEDGEGCEAFAEGHNITTGSLYKWNTILGHDGADCGTEFQLGYYYCIAAPGAVPPVPSPTQPGIADNCDSYAKAQDGEYCSEFATTHNITTANLYAWNTVLGTDGKNCGSEFFKGYYYCIGVGVVSD